ncbi:hypothetical protein CC78DRAFT_621735 [Lojkania enalia]|uniref:Uncharacterized protein n=1 Tax=Lojkania enalia TaxID=147567 RepID=A0A9P4JZH3_9PLEO|nr:hypothetical protein CC78DRAFT_621735 [Didymosphaeria enalia]
MSLEGYHSIAQIVRSSTPEEVRRVTKEELVRNSLSIPDPPSQFPRTSTDHARRSRDNLQPQLHNAYEPSAEFEDSEVWSDGPSELSDEVHARGLSEENHGVDPFLDESELSVRITELQRELRLVNERLNQTKTQLALEQSKRPVQYDDRYFEDQVLELRHQIRDWTEEFFRNSGGYVTELAKNRFRHITLDWAAYLDDERWRPRLIQARLWDSLQQHIFDAYSEKWSGYLFAGQGGKYPLDQIFAQSTRVGSPASRKAHREWTALTYNILFPGKGEDIDPAPYMQEDFEKRVRQLRGGIWRKLKGYINGDATGKQKKRAFSDLKHIMQTAIYLSLDAKKHTADLLLSFEEDSRGLRFDPHRMVEVVERNSNEYVGLIVSPPLYKEKDSPEGNLERRLLLKAEQFHLFTLYPPGNYLRRTDGISPEIEPEGLAALDLSPSIFRDVEHFWGGLPGASA